MFSRYFILDKCDCEEPCNKIVYETKAHYTKLAYDDIVAADIYFPTLTYTEFIELPTYQTIDFISEFIYFRRFVTEPTVPSDQVINILQGPGVQVLERTSKMTLIIKVMLEVSWVYGWA